MKNKKLEILAPAGNFPALTAAVYSGADAVYMGGSLFSARASAVNFTNQELVEAVHFAHVRGVKCYITVNTVLKDEELAGAWEFVTFLCSIPVDGILVQDMGLFKLISELCPTMPVHCSTQMSIHTPAGARLVHELGASRVVLARELSLKEIKEIHDTSKIELEAFVHGALCMSVSGQCYFSAMLGSRSGNRGRCAQTCRLPFMAEGGTGNDLSLKDLSFIEEIADLEKSGVCSAKIEGRMKRPEYVACAVTAAKKAANGEAVPLELLKSLEAVFSRSGFTTGYLSGKRGNDMFGIRSKEDVVSGTSALFGTLHELYKNEYQRVPLNMEISIIENEKPQLIVKDNEKHTVKCIAEEPAQKAINRPLDEERLNSQMSKLGGTPYYAENIICHTDGTSVAPMSALNSLRREAVEKLNALRETKKPLPVLPYEPLARRHVARRYGGEALKLRAVFRNIDQIPANITNLDWIYLPLGTPKEDFELIQKRGIKIGAEMPRAMFGEEKTIAGKIDLLMKMGINTFLCGNLGAVGICREKGADIHGGFSLNITNTESLKLFGKLGVKSAELSFELTLQEIAAIGGALERGIMLYGRQALMLLRNCPIANSSEGCRKCKEPHCITDRMGKAFPVMCGNFARSKEDGVKNYQYAEVFNSVPLSLSDRLKEINGADFGVLRFTVEKDVEIEEIICTLIRQKNPQNDYTRGLFYRGVI